MNGDMVSSAQTLSPAALTALTEAAGALNSTLDVKAVLGTIAQLARIVTRSEASCVFNLTGQRSKLSVAAATGHWKDAMEGREFDSRLGIPGQVVRSAQPVMIRDVRNNPRFHREIDELSQRTRTLLAVPMIHRGEVIGVVEVVNRRDERDFSEEDLKILQLFATFASSAAANARVHDDLKQQFAGLRDSVMKRTTIIGESPQHKKVMELCDRVARGQTTVLLLGETGTGKEVTARHIHNLSRRRDELFVAVNCAALPENLLESELFGHEKGAFTGAHAQHRGWFEVASKGTLFLDEIGEISRATQAKLLRSLQEKQITRVGGTESIACDTRIIAATNRNLKNMMIDGLFREDLYYRLSVFPIQLPPLRERGDDIPLFVNHFVTKAARECNIRDLRVDKETIAALRAYHWPGNIRELQNVVERSVLMSDGPILLPCHLPPEIEVVEGINVLVTLEKELLIRTLEKSGWKLSKATQELGITRGLLRSRMKKYAITREEGKHTNIQQPIGEVAPSTTKTDGDAMTLQEQERGWIIRALQDSGGKPPKAARLLGITPSSMRYRMKKFNVASSEIQPLPQTPNNFSGTDSVGSASNIVDTLYGQERALIVQALVKCDWNQSQAARALGITRDLMRHRIKKYDIRRDSQQNGRPE